MHLNGHGPTGFETLCAISNRPKPRTPNTYSNNEKALHIAAVDIAKQSMHRAVKELRSVVTENEQMNAQIALEVEVSCDGLIVVQAWPFILVWSCCCNICRDRKSAWLYHEEPISVSVARGMLIFILSQRSAKCGSKVTNIANGKCIFDLDGSANVIQAAGSFELWSPSIQLAVH